ncbi:similar to Saccharomyces cerevisiae YPL020C ULP1 Protease that specifically cleaves Smt3p protein conjugates [Maudiozyma barnettii]|uniref:Similar to Saccharomyces cerevisiae YPL020C ULP1 Protease that specifically cleaves Smt3p protein conjugates n=1 Tax=Maudiozyma barnettii TaxID=61262 RepID=A0A8H2VJ31_9SACH|nr:SUMO protease ULP1 [Kazachstania barnettii]CAB4256199.1 similar to Saccharomyces cerevisiae YPL020C ULP1 Protease that specifically cleaves Smt3p protein conjugates [Kazachstania barnettii]CAD1784807.1 similar to Saccharomyces cerevisiae YPL020C ULP1 Protease that specifically cleaves Smt3p protein conjugates [Kazachstania barnettii]
MTLQNYKRRNLQNPYTPLYSTISIYGSRYSRPSLFSTKRAISTSGYSMNHYNGRPNSRTVSLSSSINSHDSSPHSLVSINSSSLNNPSDSDDIQIVEENNRGVLTNISTGFLDTGINALHKIFHPYQQSKQNIIDLTKDLDDEDQNENSINTLNKRRKLIDLKDTDTIDNYNNNNNVSQFNLSKDPFGWDKWETTEIGASDSPLINEKNRTNGKRDTNRQYGTHFYRKNERRKENINNANMILRGRSDEVSYLRQIFTGKYEIPKIIRDERDEQLKLLERDRKIGTAQNYRIKNSIVDITERIKRVLMENRKNLTESRTESTDDDLIFVKEQKLTSLEKKRQDFYNDSFKLDQTLLEFKNEFRNYKQLIARRRQIQDEIKAKREKIKKTKVIVPQLDSSQIQCVKDALNRQDNGVLSNKDNFEVRVRDVKTLTPRRWLNDTVIEYFMKSIERTTEHTVAFNSFFYTSLSERGYQGVRRWMKRKKVQITDLDKIFVPINLNQSHWALGMIDIKNKSINYVDSLSHGPNAMSFAILNDLKGYVINESKETIGQDFELNHMSCPQQPNGFDCGIYVCLNTLYLSKDSDLTFSYEDAARMRMYIAYLIMSD